MLATPDKNPFAVLRTLGYADLVPIIPPNAPISPRSTLAMRVGKSSDSRGKAPGIRLPNGEWCSFNWRQISPDERDLQRWHAMGAGVGIKTGDGLVAIDADATSPEHAKIIRDIIEQHIGPVPTRIGRAPKALYLCRTNPDFLYRRIEFGEPRDNTRDRVEILAEGRQFVAHGIHPKTNRPYQWPHQLVPKENLPLVPPETLTSLMEALRQALPQATEVKAEGGGEPVNQDILRGEPETVRKAVAAIPNTSEHFGSRESYRDFGYAIKAAVSDQNLAFEIFKDWCGRWQGGINEPETVRADWNRMKPPFRRGASWLFETAAKLGDGSFTQATPWFEPVEETKIFNQDDRPKPSGIFATPAREIDPSKIPPRETIYGGHYVRQFVSTTVAPSKVGKSSLGIVEALAMATGRNLLGTQPKGLSRVWIWNGEDPIEEIERRVAAAMLHYKITWADLNGNLFINSGRQTEIILATSTRAGTTIAAPAVNQLKATIEANRIDVVMIDPFVSSHRVSENDNGAIDAVVKKWAAIASDTHAAIELVHHVRKLNGSEVTVEDGRGAVALLAASRSARALTRMTKLEATKLGLSAVARRLFRFAETSSNLALPPVNETSQWLELASVSLDNGPGEDAIDRRMNGDSVGVVRLFDMPAEAERLMGELVNLELLGGGSGGMGAEAQALAELASGRFMATRRAGDAWAGQVLCRAYRLDAEEPETQAKVKLVLRTWIAQGKLQEVSRPDDRGRPRSYLIVPEAALPPSEGPGDDSELSLFG